MKLNSKASIKHQPSSIHKVGFCFPNSEVRNLADITEAFRCHHLQVEIVETVYGMWTYVLTDEGNLWCHDQSHGGGGYFVLEDTK